MCVCACVCLESREEDDCIGETHNGVVRVKVFDMYCYVAGYIKGKGN